MNSNSIVISDSGEMASNSVTEIIAHEKRDLRISSCVPEDMMSEIDRIETALNLLKETDRSSRAALHSMTYPDGNSAFKLIKSSRWSIRNAVKAFGQLSDELERRRRSIAVVVHPVYNARLPVMRLPSDILHIIFEDVALQDVPSFQNLGWMRLSHVCVSWRRHALSFASLWAREIGVFRSPASFHEILGRAGGAPLTIKYRQGGSLDHFWPVISQLSRIHGMVLERSHADEVKRLADILSLEPASELRSVALNPWQDCSDITFPMMAHHPNLRWLSFENVYIPFHGQNLAGLLIKGDPEGYVPLVNVGEFLDTLENCRNLSVLVLGHWLPKMIQLPPTRKIDLPNLRIVLMGQPPVHAPYIDLCSHLVLPSLTYLALSVREATPVAVSAILNWLFSDASQSPCIKDAHRLSVADCHRQFYASGSSEVFDVRIDDGQLRGMLPKTCAEFPLEDNDLDCGVGIHLCFQVTTGQGTAGITKSAFFRCAAASWTASRSLLPRTPALKTLYFACTRGKVNWDTVLEGLVDVETLFLDDFRYTSILSEAPSILGALSRVDSQGSILLPSLRTIICEMAYLVFPDFSRSELHNQLGPSVREMLRFRAAHGAPITCMRNGSAVDKKAFLPEWDRGSDELLRGLVTTYLAEAESTTHSSVEP